MLSQIILPFALLDVHVAQTSGHITQRSSNICLLNVYSWDVVLCTKGSNVLILNPREFKSQGMLLRKIFPLKTHANAARGIQTEISLLHPTLSNSNSGGTYANDHVTNSPNNAVDYGEETSQLQIPAPAQSGPSMRHRDRH
jgi:hypothetical protein